ncbi:related to ribonuclease P chain POP1 [Rhynchosporium secalis]|uniref:Related to ribonuclease P chain POP1 n=1 Tax=Rhynchosporium secalis TaxID=38038 RepID=A0A1E1MF14_RHYSE|nr:related to ribonuclease P chain POP1 [Rhynchosporium secalis]
MPPKSSNAEPKSAKSTGNAKRKEPPGSSSSNQNQLSKGRSFKRVKYNARSILTKPPDDALKNGELNLQSFLKSREFEIKALQDGMQSAKKSGTKRAFQQVPHDLRRRTASHNVKRVPKRLQKRAAKEMKDDNTPTVNSKTKKPKHARGRLRAETAKRLGILAAKKRATKEEKFGEAAIKARVPRPKIRRNALNEPPKPKSKFRKRQVHKTWLPTHLWHAKRATMTEPKNPLWRFAIPLTSTQKSYRPIHRASGERGAVCWDMSYMSTIGLRGPEASLQRLLKAVGVTDPGLWEAKGTRWREGKRSWTGWMTREEKEKSIVVCPSTVLWSPPHYTTPSVKRPQKKLVQPQIFVRVHPAAFLEVWNEFVRLAKLQRPLVWVDDLRFEIGSIQIIGPSSTEALLSVLHPYDESEEHGKTFRSLAGITNPGSLPSNSILNFTVLDPRLRYPPRPAELPNLYDEETNFRLLELLSSWPIDHSIGSAALFDRDARFKATRLPSQKSLNRRKALAKPGEHPSLLMTDPRIPVTLIASRSASPGSAQGTWMLLAPWKCILPFWYGLMHCPLSSGSNPRLGGLQDLHQIQFEQGVPYFPTDYPGTNAGFQWELDERLKKKANWDKRPKGKRVEWDSLDLGAGRKGEVGRGWASDFEKLLGISALPASVASTDTPEVAAKSQDSTPKVDSPIYHILSKSFGTLLSSPESKAPSPNAVATLRIELVTKGIASPSARIYRFPRAYEQSSSDTTESSISSGPTNTTREQWLSLLPPPSNTKLPLNPKAKAKAAKQSTRIPLNTPLPQRVRLLAESLLQDPPRQYSQYPCGKPEEEFPLVPNEEDIIGFVTTGEFNLAEGKGVAVGSVLVERVLEGFKRDGGKDGRLCIVRNAGEKMGRLARWEAV